MFNFLWIYNVIFILHLYIVSAEISDKRTCADKDCTVPISKGVTLLRYGSDDPRILSFKEREEVTIYSKSAGKKMNLWGAEINGKRGYIPMKHIREHKILTSTIPFMVDTEVFTVESNPPSHESIVKNGEMLSPDPVQAEYDIIEGTTVYLVNDAVSTENTIVSDNSNHNKATEHLPIEDLNGSKAGSSQTQNIKSEINLEGSSAVDEFSLFENGVQESPSTDNEDESKKDLEEIEVENDDASAIIESDVDKNFVSSSTDSIKYESGASVTTNHENTSEESKSTAIPLDLHNAQDAIPIAENHDQIHITNAESLILTGSDSFGASSSPEVLEDQQSVFKSSLNVEEPHNEIVQQPQTSKFKVNKTLKEELLVGLKPVSHDPNENKDVEIEHKHDLNKPKEAVSKQNGQSHEQQTYSASNLEKDITGNDKIAHSFQSLNVPEQSLEQKQHFQTVDASQITHQNIAHDISHDHNDNLSGKNDYASIESSNDQEIHQRSSSDDNDKQSETFVKVDDTKSSMQNPLKVTMLDVIDVNQTMPRDELSDLKTKDNLATADTEIPFHDSAEAPILPASFEHHIHPRPGLFSNMVSSSAESADLHSINSDFINKNENGETFNPTTADTEEHNELPDGNQSIVLQQDVDLDTERNNVIEETNSSERNEISSFVPEDETNIGDSKQNKHALIDKEVESANDEHLHDVDSLLSKPHTSDHGSCSTGFHESDCPTDDSFHHLPVETPNENVIDFNYFKLPVFTYEVFLVLIISAVTVVVFLWGYFYIDRSKKEGPLVAKINDLQKQFLILKKENELLTEKVLEVENENMHKVEAASNEFIEDLNLQLSESKNVQLSLEQQIQTLEKDLENSTEVGLELNRILSEFLNSDNGSGTLIANIDQLQRQLVDQQGTINSYNETLTVKETELHELRLEFEISNSRVNELQSELNKMALNLLKLEEDKEQLQNNYETDLTSLKNQLEESATKFKSQLAKISKELGLVQQKYDVSQRNLELKTNEYKLLKENINHINSDNNNSDMLKSMFDTTSIKAEVLQLRNENQLINEQLQQESNRTSAFEKQAYLAMEDALQLKTKYDTADRERMEAQTKLEILSNYFKERESQLQKELSKQESMWIEKQGEANSTVERIKYMQDELQNYKAQYESLKQEILAQEVDMKSQISVLEKKAHENWVAARQAERKLEDAKQEAAQLRNRLTLRERNLNDDKVQNRIVSPLEQNGDLSLNDTGTSLPLIFGTREHLTTSPPLPSLPHFLPPPPGVPFMPPPLGGVHLPPPAFLPPPPSMIPGDHRPPPLGRISSPPLNSRYSPDSMGYSHYSRNSPSPTSDDEYDRPVYRSYSPYNRDDRRDFNRPPPPSVNRNAVRNHRNTHSSGSAHSNESLEKINRHNSKV